MATETKPWQGRQVLDESDHGGLDAAAAVEEFRNRHPREEAEDRAYKSYLRDHALKAAAHHLIGVRTAHAAGNMETARRHGAQYKASMEAAGEDPMSPPPKSVLDHVQDAKLKVAFKAHPADHFFPADASEPEEDPDFAAKVEHLKQVRSSLKA